MDFVQNEGGTFASPPALTTSAAVTTAAEVVTLKTPPTFASSLSLYAAGTPYAPASYANAQTFISADDNTVNNRLSLMLTGGFGTSRMVWVSGGTSTAMISAVWTQGVAGKIAAAGGPADQAMSFNGGAVVTSAGAALAVLPLEVAIGRLPNGFQLDGDITEFAIWPSVRVPNTGLIAGTT
jgi:hypothetical protein